MEVKKIIEERVVCLVTYFKNTDDRNIKEICRNEIEFLESLVEKSPIHSVGGSIVDKLKVLCKELNIDPEDIFLEYCSTYNGFDVLYDEGIKETYLVSKGFINA